MSGKLLHPKKVCTLSGELRFLKLIITFMILFAAANYVSFWRLLGIPGIPPLLLLFYRILDLITIIAFLYFCGSRVRISGADYLLMIFALYPFFIGFQREQFSLTFGNDIAIYFMFVAKIFMIRTAIERICAAQDISKVFQPLVRKLVLWCIVIAIMLIGSLLLLTFSGFSFYYQSPAELTFAAALVLSKGNILMFIFIVFLALLAGKRMIIIGLLSMGLVAILANSRVRYASFRFLLLITFFSPIIYYLLNFMIGVELDFLDKITGTYRSVERALNRTDIFLEFLMFVDPIRFAEYVSLKPHLTGWNLWVGNGYGFRYELDPEFLNRFGYTLDATVTNAHFTPLAIVSKFGLVGLVLCLMIMFKVLFQKNTNSSYLIYASKLAFVAMLVQSIFAFGFFINYFTAFYVAILTARKP